MVAVGPMMAGHDIRGISVFKTESLEEAKKAWAEADPAVKAGRLTVEIIPGWWRRKSGRDEVNPNHT